MEKQELDQAKQELLEFQRADAHRLLREARALLEPAIVNGDLTGDAQVRGADLVDRIDQALARRERAVEVLAQAALEATDEP